MCIDSNLDGTRTIMKTLLVCFKVDITSRGLARLIEGKSPEEIREAFNLPGVVLPELLAHSFCECCVIDIFCLCERRASLLHKHDDINFVLTMTNS